MQAYQQQALLLESELAQSREAAARMEAELKDQKDEAQLLRQHVQQLEGALMSLLQQRQVG